MKNSKYEKFRPKRSSNTRKSTSEKNASGRLRLMIDGYLNIKKAFDSETDCISIYIYSDS